MDRSGRAQNPHLASTEEYYTAAFAAFGPTPRGVDWSTEEGQAARFRQLDRIWVDAPRGSICDFGCGYGAYAEHVILAGHEGQYLGIDVSKAMVRHAQNRFRGQLRMSFLLGNEPVQADFVVASGTFNVMTGGTRRDWSAHVWRMIESMRDRACVGFAFNLILEPTSPELAREDLFWANPAEVVQRLAEMGLIARVVSDYGLHEATYLTFKEDCG